MRSLVRSISKALSLCRNLSTLARKPVIQKPMPLGNKSVKVNIKLEGNLKRSFEQFDDFKLRALLSSACQANNLETARNVFNSMKKPESDDFLTYVSLLGKVTASSRNKIPESIHAELASISSKVVADSRYYSYRKLIAALVKALSYSKSEQRKLVSQIIAKPASEAYDCGLLASFLKYCFQTNDKELGGRVWEWGKGIREREFGTPFYFSTYFQYHNLFGASVSELKVLWNQITECGLNEKADLVNSMCSALSIDRNEQKEFISQIMSSQPKPSYDCRLLGSFLVPCSIHNNLSMAKSVWSWGLAIREKEKGSLTLCRTTMQYLRIFSKNGNLDFLESIWMEAERFNVTYKKEVKNAYFSALAASHGAIERVIKAVDKVGVDSLDCHILTILLKSISEAGEHEKALELLRRCQKENPASVSIISYNSLIDGLCRIGNFDAALSLIDEAKFHGHEATEITWTTILSSCREHQNLPLAEKAFEQMKRFKVDDNRLSNAYFMMSDVYKTSGDEEKEKEIHQERLNRGLQRSQREVRLDLDGSKMISFFSNQISHTLGTEDADKIDHQMKDWIPLLEARGIPTESILKRNGEMLALAYAVSVLKMKEVFLRKEFQLSSASHEASRILSGIHGITIRHWDNIGNKASRHLMTEGKCSCKVQY